MVAKVIEEVIEAPTPKMEPKPEGVPPLTVQVCILLEPSKPVTWTLKALIALLIEARWSA